MVVIPKASDGGFSRLFVAKFCSKTLKTACVCWFWRAAAFDSERPYLSAIIEQD